jgi:hypothetical protein
MSCARPTRRLLASLRQPRLARARSLARTLLAACALSAASAGCYWSSPPTNPHGHTQLEPAKLPLLAAGNPIGLRSRRLLILGRFDSTITQPIGGLYDHDEYSISPLYRTYFFRDAALEVFEHTSDALRATGLDVRKDYATAGEPTLLEPRLRGRNPLLISATVSSLQHDQIRTTGEGAGDFEAARMVVQVLVRDADGRPRYDQQHTVEGRIPSAPNSDMLRLLGLRLGELLTHDPAFVRAVEAG